MHNDPFAILAVPHGDRRDLLLKTAAGDRRCARSNEVTANASWAVRVN